MFCKNCGNELDDNVKFCPKCGTLIKESGAESEINIVTNFDRKTNDPIKKVNKIIAILNIVMGGIIFLIALIDSELEWSAYSFWFAVGLLVIGILQLLRKSTKVISIIKIVTGSLTLLTSFVCDFEFDWTYVGLFAGTSMLVVGILELLHKSVKAVAIVEIVFSGLILLFGLAGMEYDYGWAALGMTAAFLPAGILKLANFRNYRIR